MFFQKSTLTAAAAILVISPLIANAHMLMISPSPFPLKDTTKVVDPLEGNGSNFPCRNPVYAAGKVNDWPVGSSQVLEISGAAAHGGGSCQISVTTDKEPTKASKWKVIYSIEGGCPTSSGTNVFDGSTFPFTIPKELPDGEMTMAWTWFNHIGGREMYMYCAAVKVSGGAKDNTAYDSLPDMAVANVDGVSDCKTTEGSDYTFANPGKYKTKKGNGPFKPLCDGQAATGDDAPVQSEPLQPSPSTVNPSISTSTANPSISASAPAASQASALTSTLRTLITVTAPVGTTSTSLPGSATAPPTAQSSTPAGSSTVVPSGSVSSTPAPSASASSAPASSAPAPSDPVPSDPTPSEPAPSASAPSASAPSASAPSASAPSASAPSASAPSASAPSASAPSASAPPTPAPSVPASSAPAPSTPVPTAPAAPTTTPGNTTGQTCSPDGAVICRGELEFGLCNHGTVVFQPVAKGTTCKNGAIIKRDAYMHRNMRNAV